MGGDKNGDNRRVAAYGLRPALVAVGCVGLYVVLFTLKRAVAPAENVLAECFMVFVVTAPIALGVMAWLYRKSVLGLEGAVSAALIFALGAGCFWLTVPAIFDRSVTLYLMNLLDNHAAGMTEDEIRREFIEVYFNESRGIEKRLNEQLDSGNARYEDGRYYITDGGRRVIFIARAISRAYALDPDIVKKEGGRRGD